MTEDMLAVKIFELMQRFNRGRENAEPREVIKRKLHLQPAGMKEDVWDRRFRRAYSKIPKCACPDGHYIPIRTEEVEDFRRYSLLTRPPAEVEMKVQRIYVTWPQLKETPKAVQFEMFDGSRIEARP